MEKVRVGVAGCGVVATAYYLPCLMAMENVDLAAVCDLWPERTTACARLFGARQQYQDYGEMLAHADLDAVFILTAPGTHVAFTMQAVERGKHVLIQKPMATHMEDARAIAAAVRRAGVVALIEPSSDSPLDPDYAHLRELVRLGVLGDILWFSMGWTGPTTYGPSLGSNPYGRRPSISKDSGGFLFDLPYAPSSIVAVLGPAAASWPTPASPCASTTSCPRRATTSSWRRPAIRRRPTIGTWCWTCPAPRRCVWRRWTMPIRSMNWPAAPWVPARGGASSPRAAGQRQWRLQVFGSEGNSSSRRLYASIISAGGSVAPVDADGWYHIPGGGWPGRNGRSRRPARSNIITIDAPFHRLHRQRPRAAGQRRLGLLITEMMAGTRSRPRRGNATR